MSTPARHFLAGRRFALAFTCHFPSAINAWRCWRGWCAILDDFKHKKK
jgi:hypothetical protein